MRRLTAQISSRTMSFTWHGPSPTPRNADSIAQNTALSRAVLQFKRITRALHTYDMIDEERLDARKFIYTLKNAA